ncbi:hypothetical protein ACN469_37550 [Corallococcus terminator]
MRTTFTTTELTSRLARPAFRALEGVARQLGVKLPAPAPEQGSRSHEETAPSASEREATTVLPATEARATTARPSAPSAPSPVHAESDATSGPLAGRHSEALMARPGAVAASAQRAVTSSSIPVTPVSPRAPEALGAVSRAPVEGHADSSPRDLAPSAKRGGLPTASDSRDSGPVLATDPSTTTSPAIHSTWPEAGARHTSSLPAEFSAGASRRSELPDGGALASSPTVESVLGSSPHSAPVEPAPASNDTATGLRVSVKATAPRPLQQKVVRLMRPLPPPSEAPATESGPTLQRASPPAALRVEAHSSAPRHEAPDSGQGPHYESVTSTGVAPRLPASNIDAFDQARTSIPPALPVLRVLSPTPAAFRAPTGNATPPIATRAPTEVATPPVASRAPTEVASTPPVVRPVAPSGSRPKSRLTFTPPEPVAAPSSPEPERAVPPTSLATSQVVRQVNQGMTPVLERAQQVTHAALTVERSSRPATTPAEDSGSNAAVRNTFNVNVQVGTDTATSGMDRRTLEDTLVDILRETARRHGLEV